MTTEYLHPLAYAIAEGDIDMPPGTSLNTQAVLMVGFEGTTLPTWVQRRLHEGLGGVCLFGSNIASPAQIQELTAAIYAANPDAIVAIDEEGGDVTRLHHHRGAPFPGNAVLGRLADTTLTSRVGEQVGRELQDMGIGLTLAPAVDINSNPLNPIIGVRSFGDDAEQVAQHAQAWVTGLQGTGVAACAKHFPGHGDTELDSHYHLPIVDLSPGQLRARELVPFRAAIAAGVKAIMTSHIMVPQIDPKYPATLSPRFLRDILRSELRFDGVVISDALDMAAVSASRGIAQAAALALVAGCDLLCLGPGNTDAQVEQISTAIAYATGGPALSEPRLAEAIDRVHTLGQDLRAQRGRDLPDLPADSSSLSPRLISRSFAVSHRARDLIAEHHAGRPLVWIKLDAGTNVAVGHTPWGPFASDGLEPDITLGPFDNPASMRAGIPAGAVAIVVGRDNHHHEWVRDVVDALRREVETIVVDMGWPQPSRKYADIATYGASRTVGEALLVMVG